MAADEVDAGVGRAGTEGSSARRPDCRCCPVTTRFLCARLRASELAGFVETAESSWVTADCCWPPELPDDDGVERSVTGSCPVAVGTLSTYSFGAELVSDGDGAGVLGAGVDVVGTAGAVVVCVEVPVGVDAAEGVVVWASALPPRPNTAAQARPAIAT